MIDRVLKILENNLFGCITCNIVRIYHFDGAFIIVVAIILSWMGLCNLIHVEFSKFKRTTILFVSLWWWSSLSILSSYLLPSLHYHGRASATWIMFYNCDGDRHDLHYHHCHGVLVVQPDLCRSSGETPLGAPAMAVIVIIVNHERHQNYDHYHQKHDCHHQNYDHHHRKHYHHHQKHYYHQNYDCHHLWLLFNASQKQLNAFDRENLKKKNLTSIHVTLKTWSKYT